MVGRSPTTKRGVVGWAVCPPLRRPLQRAAGRCVGRGGRDRSACGRMVGRLPTLRLLVGSESFRPHRGGSEARPAGCSRPGKSEAGASGAASGVRHPGRAPAARPAPALRAAGAFAPARADAARAPMSGEIGEPLGASLRQRQSARPRGEWVGCLISRTDARGWGDGACEHAPYACCLFSFLKLHGQHIILALVESFVPPCCGDKW
jgi:hypothetical protein